MHDELIKRLRELRPEEFGDKWDFAFAVQQAMHEAADAIEELSAIREEQKAQIILMAAEIEELKIYAELYQSLTDKSQQTARKLLDAYPKWISVTERLPEESGEYNVYVKDPFYHPWQSEDYTPYDTSYVTSAFFDKDSGLWREGSDAYYCARLDCINTGKEFCITYWMPLPEPPKEET